MKAAIKPLDLSQEFYTDEGCYITELSNTEEDPQASIARARVAPGVTTAWHQLADTAERYVILEGTGLVAVGRIPPTPVYAGDVVIIPPRCRQRITNTSTDDLIFLAICTPRFTNAVYEVITQETDEDPTYWLRVIQGSMN